MELLLHGDWMIERHGRRLAKFEPDVRPKEREVIVYGGAEERADLEDEVKKVDEENTELLCQVNDLEAKLQESEYEKSELEIRAEILTDLLLEHIDEEQINRALKDRGLSTKGTITTLRERVAELEALLDPPMAEAA